MIGSLGFLSPWILVALAALPLIYLILRLTPPRPRQVDFPPTRILFGLDDRDRTPARTPWWLTLLRLVLVALVIGALAEPVLRPEQSLTQGKEPLLVLLDNGWDTAPDFADRLSAARTAIEEAERDSRPVSLIASAEPRLEGVEADTAAAAARRLGSIFPRPYLPDRAALSDRLDKAFADRSVEVLWLAGSYDLGGADSLSAVLSRIGSRTTMLQSNCVPGMLLPARNTSEGVELRISRPGNCGGADVALFDQEGRQIAVGKAAPWTPPAAVAQPPNSAAPAAKQPANNATPAPPAGQNLARALIDLPAEIRNSATRAAIVGETSAGAVQLFDERWKRKLVGLIAGESAGGSQPLLEPLTYVERALALNADLLRSDAPSVAEAVAALIKRGASIIVLTETGTLPPDTNASLLEWIKGGGTLLRFASPQLAATSVDELLPVRLRQGERALGGSLSWEEPQPIGEFPPATPFADIAVPTEVRVNRQVLADPEALRNAEIWAELRDGTPLVTARNEGNGRIILFHVTADPRWSDLPLSGAFVDMLNAIVDTAGMVAPTQGEKADEAQPSAAPWHADRVLDGYGKLGAPDPNATLVADIARVRPSAETPPGIYERNGSIHALNTVENSTIPARLQPASLGWTGAVATLEPQPSTPIWPWLLAAAALLAALDGLAVLFLSGRLLRRHAVAALVVGAFMTFPQGDPAAAQTTPDAAMEKALKATTQTELAYVVTGNEQLDETSRAGLEGLSMYLAERTALEPGEPAPVDIAVDELAFYALIYWPIDAGQAVPSAQTMEKVDTFLKNGGTILFDTRDAGGFSTSNFGGSTPEADKLREILAFIDVPPLEPVPPDHVLTKAFYLLSDFPGRWNNSDLWVESISDAPQDPGRPARGGDGVSPILITGNDLAGAWAVDREGVYLYPTVPADSRQRELAFRAGVNIVMYALTGNYKADQVHVPALLERLGQ